MKLKRWKKYIIHGVLLMLALVAVLSLDSLSADAAVSKKLTKITATYTGSSVEVGKEVDPADVVVTAYYEVFNGYTTTTKSERVKSGFMILPNLITTSGSNKLTILYEDQVAQIYVTGKTVLNIVADYDGGTVTVGKNFAREEVTVRAYYSDGTSGDIDDFTLYSTLVTEEGLNTFPVVYADKVSFIYILGKQPLAITELIAEYHGDDLIVGSYISKADVSVFAIYNDGSVQVLKSFNISPNTVTNPGKNIVTVSFGDASDTIEVWGLRKEIEEIEVKYIGAGVIVGTEVPKDDIQVIATYNDGSTSQIGDFELMNSKIEDIGENIVVVFYDDFIEFISVNGVEGFVAKYDYNITTYLFSRDFSSYSKAVLGFAEDGLEEKFWIEPLDDVIARRVVQRVVPTEEYIPFVIAYDDDEMVTKFPLAMKVTLPYGYDPDRFGVYYTPNQRTIMAKLDGKFLDEERTEYEFVIYEPGAYILVNEVSSLLVQEIIVEEELELKTNRNYSLKPVVLPKAAENKDVEYWSTDESVATVSETGKIRTHGEGTCEIWVEAVDGSGVYAIVTIEVTDPKKKKK